MSKRILRNSLVRKVAINLSIVAIMSFLAFSCYKQGEIGVTTALVVSIILTLTAEVYDVIDYFKKR